MPTAMKTSVRGGAWSAKSARRSIRIQTMRMPFSRAAAMSFAVFSTILLSSMTCSVAGSELTRFMLIMSFRTTAVVARGIFG